MKYLGLYIKEVIKGIIIWAIVSAIAIYFYPNKITLIILAVIFLGVFAAASEAVKAAKTEESKSRLKESMSNSSHAENLELQNAEPSKTDTVQKSTNKENNSIFDDIELD
ncbi:hypothetical protein KST83_06455 [Fusobacterium nucleatum]|uniref:Uncharacterized protein n=1 Tax=Fusobacterium nucleatum subsp. polymorphum TaxID=76857 RepID=A0A2C6AZE2_FUSNP|nr:hypothetical protein [Fusobacterium polymorphum]PHH97330.1 hypothetical protein CA840_08515 [Fusobacterium polymorphum]